VSRVAALNLHNLSRTLARSLVFFTSASVLVIEILAARILAPYLGVSLEVFTGIIGVILAGISIGAWLGGRAADRGKPRSLLGPLLVAGGVAAVASPLIVDLIGPALTTGPASIVLASTLGFFAPAALLSAVPPIVVKIRLSSLDRTGSVVGSYSAIGTAGAILGTFLTGFVLIAAFPTRPIVVVIGGALTLSGVVLWASGRSRAPQALLSFVVLAALVFLFDGPCEYETTYSCAIVEEDPSNPGGRTLILDRVRNSYVDLEDPAHLEFRYVKLIADVIEVEAPRGPLDVVSVGGGGFTLPGYLNATRPGTDNTVLEIDEKLVEIGETELGLDEDVEVVAEDARTSLRRLGTDHAHVVIGDAFSGASVPWHLTTVEFAEEIKRVLRGDGVYVMNVIDYGEREFARSAALTLEQVFEHVALLAPTTYITGSSGGNYILVASSMGIDVMGIEQAIRSRASPEIGVTGPELDDFIDGAAVLTDDFAPVDQIVGHP
jgi:spermidine synthase